MTPSGFSPQIDALLRSAPDVPASGKSLLVVEGKKTEPAYFKAVRDRLGLKSADVELVFAGSDPLNMVNEAIRLRKTRQAEECKRLRVAYDEAWVVFDTEVKGHPRTPRMREACTLAQNEDIRLAISNSCFEVWLLLHFRNADVGLTNCPKTEAALTACLPQASFADYQKGEISKDAFMPNVGRAVERARRLRSSIAPVDRKGWGDFVTAYFAAASRPASEGDGVPSTDVDLLMDVLNWNAHHSRRLYSAR